MNTLQWIDFSIGRWRRELCSTSVKLSISWTRKLSLQFGWIFTFYHKKFNQFLPRFLIKIYRGIKTIVLTNCGWNLKDIQVSMSTSLSLSHVITGHFPRYRFNFSSQKLSYVNLLKWSKSAETWEQIYAKGWKQHISMIDRLCLKLFKRDFKSKFMSVIVKIVVIQSIPW